MSNEIQSKKVKVPFFKKWWVMLILGFVLGGIVFGSASGGSDSSTGKITDEKATTTASTPAKKETAKPVEKAPIKVFENDVVVISYKDVTSDGVRFLVENKTSKPITIQADSVAVNGFSANNIMMSDDISPNSKGYAIAQTDELSDAGTPKTISGSLNVLDTETMDNKGNAHFTNIKVN